MGQGGVLMKDDLPASLAHSPQKDALTHYRPEGDSLKEMLENTEKDILKSHLDQMEWNRVKTAEKLKMKSQGFDL